MQEIITQLKNARDRALKDAKLFENAIRILRQHDGARHFKIVRRDLSVAARRRIAQAQRDRWAKWHKQKAT